MGKRGPQSQAPGGYGSITPKGYRRIRYNGRYRMEHCVVWEQHYGAVPDGMQVHHKDGNKLNNAIGNLELLSPLEHKREHSGCELRDGIIYKPCRKCGVSKPLEVEFYKRKGSVSPWCRACCIANAVDNKRRRRAARQLSSDM